MSNSFRDFNQALISDLRANQGRASSGPFKGADVLILTTTGAKTGKPRENPLAFSSENGDYVVVASKGGAPTNPAWYHNLRARPEVTVEVGADKFRVRASPVDGDERRRLYDRHAARLPAFADYEQRTSRRIPVIVLERLPE